MYFGSIFGVKRVIAENKITDNAKLSNFIAGTISGVLGTFFNIPWDVVKTRIQKTDLAPVGSSAPLGGSSASSAAGQNSVRIVPVLTSIVKEEGVKALWKGFVPKVARLGPGGGLMLVVYEWVADFLRGS